MAPVAVAAPAPVPMPTSEPSSLKPLSAPGPHSLPTAQSSTHIVTPHPPAPAEDTSVFPDGHRTCGLPAPIPGAIFPPEAFPAVIEGPTVWRGEDMAGRTGEWVRPFTPQEIGELGEAADRFIESKEPLTGMRKELFPLPTLGSYFDELKPTILDGRGFVLFKNIPVDLWGNHKSAVAYMGIGTYFGYFTSQNGKGHVLGHVQDLAEAKSADPNAPPTRIYRTNKRQHFHTDSADLVGLLCMSKAEEGGESDIVSTHDLYNTLRREHPDVWALLVRDVWYFDRKGEISRGQEPYYRAFMLGLTNEPDARRRRVFNRFDPLNLTTLGRYSSGPDARIPPLSAEQVRALEVVEATAKRLALHMVLEPGDVQLLANTHILHARTAYKDWAPGSVDEQGRPRKQRQLMRLWLATPEDEGGWKLPYWDSRQKKRAGIQVDDTPPYCPLFAE